MTKPVQIQPVAWMYTWKEDAGNKFLGPVLKHVREPSGVLTGWNETPLVSAAAVRSLLEAKAKEWQDAPYAQNAGLDYHNKHPQHAEECDNRAEMIQGMASELLALAATLGNQGK